MSKIDKTKVLKPCGSLMQVKSIVDAILLTCIKQLLVLKLFFFVSFEWPLKETKSATMNIFEIFYFLFKSFAKVELSYVFIINLFTIAENCTEK